MSNKLYVFSAEWCGGCKPFKDRLTVSGIEFINIDVDTKEGAELADDHNVKGIPTCLVTDSMGNKLLLEAGPTAFNKIKELMS